MAEIQACTDVLIEQWRDAQTETKDAEERLRQARRDEEDAEERLCKRLAPTSAEDGEAFHVWGGDKLLRVTVKGPAVNRAYEAEWIAEAKPSDGKQ